VQADVAQAVGEHLLGYLASGPAKVPPTSAPWPAEFERRVRYTLAEHPTNGAHRKRVRASV
jgi:DNA (cytosine-5)-methyltransferase 1